MKETKTEGQVVFNWRFLSLLVELLTVAEFGYTLDPRVKCH